ncbi:hypothetical protein PoB_005019300 [Plakobranchus ocellatus]|uniref:Uncharacterized protein n=1 Tax=Plakobranchus ocellatus TaxID=259542 RepID=A0AAV4BWU5_9GAST|nr:hypothetical protein PoB_005019300 [Plakobranchus ocellatus]
MHSYLRSHPIVLSRKTTNKKTRTIRSVQDTKAVVPTLPPDPTPSPNTTDQTLKNLGIASMQKIRPSPTAVPRDQTKNSAIITDTPERLHVLEKQKNVMKPKKNAARRKLIESSECEEEQNGNEHDTDRRTRARPSLR